MKRHFLKTVAAAAVAAASFTLPAIAAGHPTSLAPAPPSRTRCTPNWPRSPRRNRCRPELPVDRLLGRHQADPRQDRDLRRHPMHRCRAPSSTKGRPGQFPAIIGGTVPVVNLDGFKPGELRVSGTVLADMYLGKIAKWNDARLAALNPGKNLPDQAITIVHPPTGSRAPPSAGRLPGTVSRNGPTRWAGATGEVAGRNSVGGKDNEGVAANVNRVKGALGCRIRLRQEEQHELHICWNKDSSSSVRTTPPSRPPPPAWTGTACQAWACRWSMPRATTAGRDHRLLHPDVQEPGRQGAPRRKR